MKGWCAVLVVCVLAVIVGGGTVNGWLMGLGGIGALWSGAMLVTHYDGSLS